MKQPRASASRILEPLGLDALPWRRARPEPLPLRLGRGRIYVLPTRAGMAFLAALVVMLLAAINYNLSLGYGVVFMLAGIGLVSLLHAFRNLHALVIADGRADPVFAGEILTLAYRVTNPGPTRRAALVLRTRDDRAQIDLEAGAEAEIRLAQPTTRRGRVSAARVCVETCWPLGLIRAWSVFRADRSAVVFPAPEKPAPPLPAGSGEGRAGATPQPADDDFAGLRGHRPSDSPRHVAWKVVAGGGPLLTKEFSGGSGETLHLDWHATPAPSADARASRLAAWVIEAEARGVRYRVRTPAGETAASQGEAHARACLALLAVTETPDA